MKKFEGVVHQPRSGTEQSTSFPPRKIPKEVRELLQTTTEKQKNEQRVEAHETAEKSSAEKQVDTILEQLQQSREKAESKLETTAKEKGVWEQVKKGYTWLGKQNVYRAIGENNRKKIDQAIESLGGGVRAKKLGKVVLEAMSVRTAIGAALLYSGAAAPATFSQVSTAALVGMRGVGGAVIGDTLAEKFGAKKKGRVFGAFTGGVMGIVLSGGMGVADSSAVKEAFSETTEGDTIEQTVPTTEPITEPTTEPITEPILEETEAPPDTTASSEIVPTPYVVAEGDTMWGILTEKFALTDSQKATFLQKITGLPEAERSALVKNFGITSGNIDLIRPGETVNLEKIQNFLSGSEGTITTVTPSSAEQVLPTTEQGAVTDIPPTPVSPVYPEEYSNSGPVIHSSTLNGEIQQEGGPFAPQTIASADIALRSEPESMYQLDTEEPETIPNATTSSEMATKSYSIQRGDTMQSILTEKFALTDSQKATFLQKITGLPEAERSALVKNFGITSGNIDLIRPGETVNLEKIQNFLSGSEQVVSGNN